MKKKHDVKFAKLLLVMLCIVPWLTTASRLTAGGHIEEICKISVYTGKLMETETKTGMTPENLEKQLNYFREISALVNHKNRTRLYHPFTGLEKKKISGLLLQAAELETDDCHKNYLSVLSKNISQAPRFSTTLPRWGSLEKNRAEIIFPVAAAYPVGMAVMKAFFNIPKHGPGWEKGNCIDTVVYVNHAEDTRKFAQYSGIFVKMQDNLPPGKKYEMPYSPPVPSFKISQLVSTSMPAVSQFTMIYPHTGDTGDTGENSAFRIIVFKNLVKAYYDEILKPVAGRVLVEARVPDADYDAFMSNLIMQRISHHLGPVFAVKEVKDDDEDKFLLPGQIQKRKAKQKKKKKKEKELKLIRDILEELFPVIEDLKARMIAIHSTRVLIENGLIPENSDIDIYAAYLVSLIDGLRHTPDIKLNVFGKMNGLRWLPLLQNPHGSKFLSSLIQFNFLLQREGIVFNINSRKLDINPLQFKEAVELLTGEILKTVGTATYQSAKMYIDRKLTSDAPQLEEILKGLEDIPLSMEFQLERGKK
ncbi:MAG: hypothetical protein GY950_10715 [bacterium]|nr:hypothetical protein [bacterium]